MFSFDNPLLNRRRDTRAAAPAREALDRTMRLMRDNLNATVSDETLMAALLRPRVLVAASEGALLSPAAQTALVTTTLLLLRSGATVALSAPDVPLHHPQPPLVGNRLVSALLEIGDDLIDGVHCLHASVGGDSYDAVVVIGTIPDGTSVSPRPGDDAPLLIHLTADAVTGRMISTTCPAKIRPSAWDESLRSPFGALAAAGLAAGEVFKLVMRSLSASAESPDHFEELFAVSAEAAFSLDPAGELGPSMVAALDALGDVGAADVISGGAIAQAFLYALARLPGVRGDVRVIEPETSDATNLNRYALLRRSVLGEAKAVSLSAMSAAGLLGELSVTPVVVRYDRSTPAALGGLAPAVIVGVDHIPTRWAAQKGRPEWLGIGATSHYSAMSSDHVRGTPCAWCLHPADAPDIGPIPTVAFVSHWAGLLLAWRFVRHRLGLAVSLEAQYDFLTPLRPDLRDARWRSPVAARPDCPNRCVRRQHAAA